MATRPSPTWPLFKRSTSTQLIKYRYNALCGNANWIHDARAPVCVCVYVYLHMLDRKMYIRRTDILQSGTSLMLRSRLKLAPLSLSRKKLMSRNNPCLDGPPLVGLGRFSEKSREKKLITERIRSRIDYERTQSSVVGGHWIMLENPEVNTR